MQKSDDSIAYLIDKPINKEGSTLLHRYIAVKDENFNFDVTCTNLTQLIGKMPTIKWGIDSSGKIFNFTNKQKFRARCVKIVKVKNNLIWVDTVTYPYKLRKNILDAILLKEQYAIIVYIDKEWVLKKFVSFYEPINEILL